MLPVLIMNEVYYVEQFKSVKLFTTRELNRPNRKLNYSFMIYISNMQNVDIKLVFQEIKTTIQVIQYIPNTKIYVQQK